MGAGWAVDAPLITSDAGARSGLRSAVVTQTCTPWLACVCGACAGCRTALPQPHKTAKSAGTRTRQAGVRGVNVTVAPDWRLLMVAFFGRMWLHFARKRIKSRLHLCDPPTPQ